MALLLQGEAGIGKTTLWQCGVKLARDSGQQVLSSSPRGGEVQLSFAALGGVWGAEIRFSRCEAVFVDQPAEAISALNVVCSR